MTARLVAAVESPHTDVLGHCTGHSSSAGAARRRRSTRAGSSTLRPDRDRGRDQLPAGAPRPPPSCSTRPSSAAASSPSTPMRMPPVSSPGRASGAIRPRPPASPPSGSSTRVRRRPPRLDGRRVPPIGSLVPSARLRSCLVRVARTKTEAVRAGRWKSTVRRTDLAGPTACRRRSWRDPAGWCRSLRGPADFSDVDADPARPIRRSPASSATGTSPSAACLYWRGRRPLSASAHPDELDVAARVAGAPGIGPAGIAAADASGSRRQAPADRRSPSRDGSRPVHVPLRRPVRKDRSYRPTAPTTHSRPVGGSRRSDRVIEREDDGAWPSLVRLVQDGSVQADRWPRRGNRAGRCRVRLRNLLLDAGKTTKPAGYPKPRSTIDAA